MYIYTCIHIHIHTNIHAYTHMHIIHYKQTRIHTYTQIHTLVTQKSDKIPVNASARQFWDEFQDLPVLLATAHTLTRKSA